MPTIDSQFLLHELELSSGREERLVASAQKRKVDTPALYLLAGEVFDQIYGIEERAAIETRVKTSNLLITPQHYRESTESWPEIEIIFSGWGMVPMDEAFFQRFPKLKVVFYGAGTVRGFVTDEFWRHKIRLTNAASANAVPVSEYTISQILFALKHGWQQALFIRERHKFPPQYHPPGAYKTTVGLISLGMIGSLVAERLQQHDLKVVAYDPLIAPEEAARLKVKLVSLKEVFAVADVVSCHAPALKETEKMIQRRHFESMKSGATFINTARGAVVHEEEMIQALKERPDLFAMLDVTEAMPPVEGSPLYTLPNVMLTPHIAGCLGPECRRMGKLMVDELDRFLSGKSLRYEIDEVRFQTMA